MTLYNNEIDDKLIQSNVHNFINNLEYCDDHFIKVYLSASITTIASTLNFILFDKSVSDNNINDFTLNFDNLEDTHFSEIFKTISMCIYIAFINNKDNIEFLEDKNISTNTLLDEITKCFNYNKNDIKNLNYLINERESSQKEGNPASYYIKLYRLIIQPFNQNKDINPFAAVTFQKILLV